MAAGNSKPAPGRRQPSLTDPTVRWLGGPPSASDRIRCSLQLAGSTRQLRPLQTLKGDDKRSSKCVLVMWQYQSGEFDDSFDLIRSIELRICRAASECGCLLQDRGRTQRLRRTPACAATERSCLLQDRRRPQRLRRSPGCATSEAGCVLQDCRRPQRLRRALRPANGRPYPKDTRDQPAPHESIPDSQ